jgi:hypothetical protein
MLKAFRSQRGVETALALLLLGLFALLTFRSLRLQSITYDEEGHWRYGRQVLIGETRRFDDSKMPVTALNALAARALAPGPAALQFRLPDPTPARLATVLAACVLGMLVFAWARALHGPWAGAFSLFLYGFDPNIQAHAQWITTDLYAALGVTAALFLGWRFVRRPDPLRAVLAGAALGFALLTKFSCVFLFALLPVLALLHGAGRRGRLWIQAGLLVLPVSLAVLAAGYLGNGWGTPLESYAFKSALFKTLQEHAGWAGRIPLPVPRPFLEGIDWVRFNEVTGVARGPAYLFGETSREGFPNYYAIVFFFKTPLALWMLLIAALGSLLPRGQRRTARDELFLLLPAAFFFLYFNQASRAQMGMRFLLPILPLLAVFCGRLVPLARGRAWRAGLLAAAGATLAVSTLSYYPHTLSYFNELAGDRRLHYRLLADSNLDWGQSEGFIRDYVRQHPDTQVNPAVPGPGRVAISANLLTGILYPEMFAWARMLREREPEEHVAYSYLIYTLSAEDAEEARRHLPERPGGIFGQAPEPPGPAE